MGFPPYDSVILSIIIIQAFDRDYKYNYFSRKRKQMDPKERLNK